ncbi:hypothetical protein FHU38_005031 [Saccharomonospora amisosensis]|uniref:Uncharacterized protein n=1 Tax=Saccharomonospora amisosensis TaxID=1128677 RepID=A0A7X5UV16_9PSEU|nr:hypothetical protein [Saccharomonospora amisosensis]NIJ14630.1 hypothetical protein [Saccharomonospora amisosensis]
MAKRWVTLQDGRKVLINTGGGAAKVVVGAAVTAVALYATGMPGGLSALAGGSSGAAAGSSSVNARSLNARKADAKHIARIRNLDAALRRVGMRIVRQTVSKSNRDCVTAAYGKVQQSFLRNPCKSLNRKLYATADPDGNVVLISVAWVSFRTAGQQRAFRDVIDEYGTGDIRPLGAGLLGMADIRFTGRNYHSEPRGARLTVAEAEAATGAFDTDVLDGIAEIAAQVPRPPRG